MKDNLELFLNKVFNVPLWTKLAVKSKMYDEMKEFSNCKTLSVAEQFVMYSPVLSFGGKQELDERKCGFDGNLYNFLKYCEQGLGFLAISVNTFLSLEEVAKCFIFCIEQNFIDKNIPNEILTMSEYISGKIRLGEYFVKAGFLTQEQSDSALCEQNKNSGNRFGEILLQLNCINKNDLKAVLTLKAEAQRRFVLDYGILPKSEISYSSEKSMQQDEILKLKEENQKLKQKLQKLRDVVNKVIR